MGAAAAHRQDEHMARYSHASPSPLGRFAEISATAWVKSPADHAEKGVTDRGEDR